ncbi:hypothetical protein [Allochromatium tepidum]|uniref:hypothetical protein n=1 Tax=Allochromatium tepidum TaxID=553982 RepID=UPI001BD0D493|nr:hypothetical protein [Allochromatium tepidum]
MFILDALGRAQTPRQVAGAPRGQGTKDNSCAAHNHTGRNTGIDPIGLILIFLLLDLMCHQLTLGFVTAAERLPYLLGQPVLQIVVDFARAGVEDAVDTEVEFRAVDLEDLTQLGDEFLKFWVLLSWSWPATGCIGCKIDYDWPF